VKPDRVAVLGCGPAGAAAAITLAARDISVVAIDPRPVGQWEPGEGLPAAANAALRKLGLWPSFQAGGHLPASGFRSCWGSAEPAFRPALLDPRGPSWQLDRVRFNQMLRDAVDSLLSSRVTEVRRDGPQWILTLSDQLPMSVDFIVDATGRSGRLRRAPRRVDSRLVGITALLPDPSPGDAAGIVEAVPEGWWYASRIPGGRLTVALFTDASIASQADWSDLMAKTGFVGQRAGWPRVEQLRTVRAGSSSLEHLAGPGWLAVGDAACAHDPLSSRGLHDALTGGIAAAEAIVENTVPAYAEKTAADYRAYLKDLDWYYRQETRFPDSPFWQARRR
jgi:flavin-dependent dehydrogenase